MTILHSDNQGPFQRANYLEFHSQDKCIHIQQHFRRKVVANKLMDIDWISTSKMPADWLRKQLPKVKFERFIQRIGLENATFPVVLSQVQN